MKKISKILKIFSILLVLNACSSDFLDEKPLDFLTTNNAFQTKEDYTASVNNLYGLTRDLFYTGGGWFDHTILWMGTELTYPLNPVANGFGDYVQTLDPTSKFVDFYWDSLYKIIAESNTILSRVPLSELSDSEKSEFEAKSKFFRGLAYRTLVYLYGGVPLVVEEVQSPKYDFVRASKQDVFAQIIEDLEFSANNLPDIDMVKDGEIHNLAAYHLLAEVYNANEQYDKAIAAATVVIDDPNTALMRERFGRRTDQPGDVYWDLFQRGNQNRSSGNTEGIWVAQIETDVPGGSAVTSTKNGSYKLELINAPSVNQLIVAGGKQPIIPFTSGVSARGIGWAINTLYFTNTIWESDFDNDMRNSNYNFIREFLVNNSKHPLYGQIISTENPPEGVIVPDRAWYAYQTKISTPGDHPLAIYKDFENQILNSGGGAGGTFRDLYFMRLAETYLLRAEAYLGKGDLVNAAADINVIRERAGASPVSSGDVDIDYILDERMRELGMEEKRQLTLRRMGKLYERVRLAHTATLPAGVNYQTNYDDIKPHHELFPIPFSAIEANTEAVLEQNPGY